MKTFLKYKNTLLAILVFLLIIAGYKMFLEEAVPLPSVDSSVSTIGADLVRTYADLQEITFDQTLFSSSLYKGLVDFSVSLSEQPKGRTNPFDILGKD